MKTHKVVNPGISVHFNGWYDMFNTWCGISDLDNPSEELMDNLVKEEDKCTCIKCNTAYKKAIKKHDERLNKLAQTK